MGSLSYIKHEENGGGVIITAANREPMGRLGWMKGASLSMAVAAMAMFVVAGLTDKSAQLDLRIIRISASPWTFAAAGVLMGLLLLRLVAAAIAKERHQRVVLDATPQRLVVRKESPIDGQQEGRLWKAEELESISAADGLLIVSKFGERYELELGRTLEERQWAANTLRQVLNLPEFPGFKPQEV